MSQTQEVRPEMFSQVDVTAGCTSPAAMNPETEQSELLRRVLSAQDRTNEILEELVALMSNNHKQRAQELYQWKNAHPRLAESCRDAANALGKVQHEYIERLTEEINYSSEDMIDGEFVLNEFIDRFGPRLAHLNGVIQVLANLGSNAKTFKGQS